MELTAVKLNYLFLLYEQEENAHTVSSLAKILGVAKSTVSRTIHCLEEQGFLVKDTFLLTEYGKNIARQYLEERNIIADWLMSEQHISYELAMNDATAFILSVSKDMKEIVLGKARNAMLWEKISKIEHLDGQTVTSLFADGTYALPFTMYREKSGKHNFISMSDRAFHHPASFIVKNGTGMVHLLGREIEETSKLGCLKLKGRLVTLKYLWNHKYLLAGQDQSRFIIPLDSLEFHYNSEEKMLQGSVKLKMSCSVGSVHMPESVAIMTVLIR